MKELSKDAIRFNQNHSDQEHFTENEHYLKFHLLFWWIGTYLLTLNKVVLVQNKK